MTLPESNDPDDTLILICLGNSIFKKKDFNFVNGVWHLDNPEFLNDFEIANLVDKTVDILNRIKINFKGKIKVIGPPPRHTKKCCMNKNHHFKFSRLFPSTLTYILYLTMPLPSS